MSHVNIGLHPNIRMAALVTLHTITKHLNAFIDFRFVFTNARIIKLKKVLKDKKRIIKLGK